MQRKYSLGRGFSLTELLTVIGIIALLVMIMMPTLVRARSHARATLCAGNLHNINVAWSTWNAQKSRTGSDAQINPWMWPLELLPHLSNRERVLLCPEDGEPAVAGLDSIKIRVYSGGNFLYDMDIFPSGTSYGDADAPGANDLTWKVNEEEYERLWSEGLLQEGQNNSGNLTRYTPGNNANAYYLLFEDIRPSGGDRDYEDLMLHIIESENGVQIAGAKEGGAGYYFDLLGPDGQMLGTHVGETNLDQSWGFASAIISYGVNVLAPTDTTTKETIVALDYKRSVANVVGANAEDDWSSMVAPRHSGKCNVLFGNGTVLRKSPIQIDPDEARLAKTYWQP